MNSSTDPIVGRSAGGHSTGGNSAGGLSTGGLSDNAEQRLDTLGDAAATSSKAFDAFSATRFNALRIAGLRLLLPSETYCELLVKPKISKVPNAPSRMLGIINLRGNLIPLYQIHEALGVPLQRVVDAEGGALPTVEYAVLLGTMSKGAAIVIEDKPQIIARADTTPTRRAPTVPYFLESSVCSAQNFEGETWLEVDPGEFFQKLSSPGFTQPNAL